MFPQEKLRNFTYASAQTIDINLKIIRRTGEKLQKVKTLYKVLIFILENYLLCCVLKYAY